MGKCISSAPAAKEPKKANQDNIEGNAANYIVHIKVENLFSGSVVRWVNDLVPFSFGFATLWHLIRQPSGRRSLVSE